MFATKEFGFGDLIEHSPLIVISDKKDAGIIDFTVLGSYVYQYGDEQSALGMGFASFYNHSTRPNAAYDIYEVDDVIVFYALRAIKPGTQIKVNYNGDPRDKTKINFEEWS